MEHTNQQKSTCTVNIKSTLREFQQCVEILHEISQLLDNKIYTS